MNRTSSVVRVLLCLFVCCSFGEPIAAQGYRPDEDIIAPPKRDPPSSTPKPSRATAGPASKATAANTWDVDKAIKHLQENAQAKSSGQCAKFVRRAIEAGSNGASMQRTTHAKDYGTSLVGIGFHEFSSTEITPDKFEKGDVVVIQATKGHPSGHMAMYDGEKWISDFEQRDHWGGSIRNDKPAYRVYRRVQPSANTPSAGQNTTGAKATKPFGGVLINPVPRRDGSKIDEAKAQKVLRTRPGAKARTWRIKLPNGGSHHDDKED